MMNFTGILLKLHRRQFVWARARVAAWIVGVAALASVGLQAVLRVSPTPNPYPNRRGCSVSMSERNQVIGMAQAIELFMLLKLEGRCPADFDELVRAGVLRLDDLKDSWNRPYVFSCSADSTMVELVVCTYGSDVHNSRDDICSRDDYG